ncbi:MAG TPA: hemerythrin domain-containing protein [Blastocatellia bacterium]|nr:hemerythrin domain-containing protein [Blastocatellia bacterium]
MNVLEFLKQDHQEAMSMMGLIENANTGGQQVKMDLFNQLKGALTLHTRMEEQIFYPELENHQETRDLIREAYSEHQEVDELLAEISALSPTSGDFSDKFTELKDSVEHHVDEEENQLFPKVRQIIDQEKLNEMGRRMMEMKQGMRQSKSVTANTKRK